MSIRQADVARAPQQSLDGDPALGPGEGASGTRVDAAAEGEVLPRVGAAGLDRKSVV